MSSVRSLLTTSALILACVSCGPSAAETAYGGHNAATMRDADTGSVNRPPHGAPVSRIWTSPGGTTLSDAQIDEITGALLDPAFIASLEPADAAVVRGKSIGLSSYDSNGVLVLVDTDAPIIELIDSGEPSDRRFKVREPGMRTLGRLRDL